ncbi:hypothetical protein HU200_025386 [Digitaria exilis]|uniref:Uncharacterized protein n=1 Tax=Digitaria exilis TaxID=1010633 RepID=A0A835C0R8_9POAL|nr:hypothetical protein HU200_025386 [Digitaria exilis]
MASISMHLSEYDTLRLPVPGAARYDALTELMLDGGKFEEAGGRTLGDFVSCCCPRLRKLDISSPTGLPQLVIRSETLEELSLFLAEDLRTLDVRAPSMRVLMLQFCFAELESFDTDGQVTNNVARIVAPKLEEIKMRNFGGRRRPELEIHGLASVRRLGKHARAVLPRR